MFRFETEQVLRIQKPSGIWTHSYTAEQINLKYWGLKQYSTILTNNMLFLLAILRLTNSLKGIPQIVIYHYTLCRLQCMKFYSCRVYEYTCRIRTRYTLLQMKYRHWNAARLWDIHRCLPVRSLEYSSEWSGSEREAERLKGCEARDNEDRLCDVEPIDD